MYSDKDDDALMALTARGEETAFRLLVQRWEHQIKAFLVHMLGSLEEAEDLTQDTFVKIYGLAGRYQAEGKFRSWALRIAGNMARSRLRRRKILGWIRFDPQVHDTAGGGLSPVDQLQQQEVVAAVNEALAKLPDRQKQALVLHRFQGLKYREIAQVMETTVPGVESLIQRATATLRVRLSSEGGAS